jgi:hypothetical protein
VRGSYCDQTISAAINQTRDFGHTCDMGSPVATVGADASSAVCLSLGLAELVGCPASAGSSDARIGSEIVEDVKSFGLLRERVLEGPSFASLALLPRPNRTNDFRIWVAGGGDGVLDDSGPSFVAVGSLPG